MGKKFEYLTIKSNNNGMRLGRTLQKDIPKIAQDYRKGLSKLKIAEKHYIEERYNVAQMQLP